jgi:hypothetical protein
VLAGKSADRPVGDTQVYGQDLDRANAAAEAIIARNSGP